MLKLVKGNLNLLLLHDKNDPVKELVLVKTTPRFRYLIKEMTKKTNMKCSLSGWMPLKSVVDLLERIPREERDEYNARIVAVMSRFRSTMSKHSVRLTHKLTPELLYLTGAIIGDGSLSWYRKRKIYHVYFCNTNKQYTETFSSLMRKTFDLKFIPKGKIRPDKKALYEWRMSSKPLHRFFSKLMDIPIGYKSHVVRIPSLVRKLDPVKRVPLICGLMDTDWGHEFYTFGSGCASRRLLSDTHEVLRKVAGIDKGHLIDRPYNAKSGSYSLIVPKKELSKLMIFRSGLRNPEKTEMFDMLAGRTIV